MPVEALEIDRLPVQQDPVPFRFDLPEPEDFREPFARHGRPQRVETGLFRRPELQVGSGEFEDPSGNGEGVFLSAVDGEFRLEFGRRLMLEEEGQFHPALPEVGRPDSDAVRRVLRAAQAQGNAVVKSPVGVKIVSRQKELHLFRIEIVVRQGDQPVEPGGQAARFQFEGRIGQTAAADGPAVQNKAAPQAHAVDPQKTVGPRFFQHEVPGVHRTAPPAETVPDDGAARRRCRTP